MSNKLGDLAVPCPTDARDLGQALGRSGKRAMRQMHPDVPGGSVWSRDEWRSGRDAIFGLVQQDRATRPHFQQVVPVRPLSVQRPSGVEKHTGP